MKKGLIIIVLLTILACIGVGLLSRYAWVNRDGPCQRVNPLGALHGGWIKVTGQGMFQTPVKTYYLSYSGTYSRSGNPCWWDWSVTEAQYNRKMFGIGKDTKRE